MEVGDEPVACSRRPREHGRAERVDREVDLDAAILRRGDRSLELILVRDPVRVRGVPEDDDPVLLKSRLAHQVEEVPAAVRERDRARVGDPELGAGRGRADKRERPDRAREDEEGPPQSGYSIKNG